LLARIRDIRSSEKVFWKKVLEIYATSIDYDARAEASQLFFRTVQNKMHWAAHGHTAAEVIAARADAKQPNMGLTTWTGAALRKADVTVAKNYLAAEELEALNRIVAAYLEFAELQALGRKPMYMADWIAKLDEFLRLSEREILTEDHMLVLADVVAKRVGRLPELGLQVHRAAVSVRVAGRSSGAAAGSWRAPRRSAVRLGGARSIRRRDQGLGEEAGPR